MVSGSIGLLLIIICEAPNLGYLFFPAFAVPEIIAQNAYIWEADFSPTRSRAGRVLSIRVQKAANQGKHDRNTRTLCRQSGADHRRRARDRQDDRAPLRQ